MKGRVVGAVLLALLVASPVRAAQNPRGAAAVKELVRREWGRLPATMPLSQRITELADLSAGRLQPHLLPSAGDVGAIQTISDVNGDGRTEVVVSYETHGSGWGRGWHRQHTEVWRWRDGAYHLAAHTAPPPDTDREAVNDAEARFRRQEYARTLPPYRQALQLPAEGGWRPYIHYRLGQTLASSGPLAPAAEAFSAELRRSGLPAAFAAVLVQGRVQLTRQWRLEPSDLAPPTVMLQAYFAAGGTPEGLRGAGIPAEGAVAADLDGDGDPEVWVRLAPYEPYQPTGFLAVRGQDGWRVGPAESFALPAERPLLPEAEARCRRTYQWDMLELH